MNTHRRGLIADGLFRAILIIAAVLLFTSLLHAQFGVGGGTSTAQNTNRVLCSIRAANFNTTADQACTIPVAITAWAVSSVSVTNCSTSLTLAIGGVYPAASKGGTALVANTQIYSALTGATVLLSATLAAGIVTTRYTINTVYLALTTAQGGAATCDFYVIGTDLT